MFIHAQFYDSLQSQPNPNPIEILTPSILLVWSFVLIFCLCQCGEFVMNEFDEFADELYQCNWHLFPVEMQRKLVIVMLNTQQSPTIHGYANTFCTREAFKKVSFLEVVKCLKLHKTNTCVFSHCRLSRRDFLTLWWCVKLMAKSFSV